MTKRSTRPWIQVDVGLLDDERFAQTPAHLRGVWLTAYLVIAREGDTCKNRQRLSWLLRREGIKSPDRAILELDRLKWLEDLGEGTVTIRGFNKHQPLYRGRSDLPDAKAERNARRPTTRGERERRGASVERVERQRRGEEIKRAAPDAPEGAGPRTYDGPEKPSEIIERLRSAGIPGQPGGVVS